MISASKQLGIGVQKARELRRWTIEEYAEKLGAPVDEVQGLEKGELIFGGGYPERVAAALEVPLQVVILLGADLSELSDGERQMVEKLRDLATLLIEPGSKS